MQTETFPEMTQLPPGVIPISGAISGGDYEIFLADTVKKFGENICLILSSSVRRFSLPCYDGQGESLADGALEIYLRDHPACYSHRLCINYIYVPQEPAVILFDSETTIARKKKLADKHGIKTFPA